MPAVIGKRPGTYLLIFACQQVTAVQVGRLGKIKLQPGYYCYVGSAFGPGGIGARVAHHEKFSQKPHWHLDYVRPQLQLISAWYQHDVHKEHHWANILAATMTAPLSGFGASDCTCDTHFFYSITLPDISGYAPEWRNFQQSINQHIFYNEFG